MTLYFDLRTNTVIYSKSLRDASGMPDDYVLGTYRLRHNSKLVAERSMDEIVYGLSLSPGYYDHPNTEPYELMGYWEKEETYSTQKTFLPSPEKLSVAVDNQCNALGSIKFRELEGTQNYITPAPLNYISEGNIDEILFRVPETYSLTGAGVQ